MRIPGTDFEYGRPQFFATLLLLAFVIQVLIVAASHPRTSEEIALISRGIKKLHGIEGWQAGMSVECSPSPLSDLLAAIPWGLGNTAGTDRAVALTRIPFVLLGAFLAATVWWVARRLYGNPGGYIALSLYVFSPSVLLLGGTANNAIGLALGWFSVVFLAIGLAHNLYAPSRHWVFRFVLLTVALAGGLTLHWGVLLSLPLALFFMCYLAPARRGSAFRLWLGAIIASFAMVLFGTFVLNSLLRHMTLQPSNGTPVPAFGEYFSTAEVGLLGAALCVSLLILGVWPRTRYFGNWAPLAAAAMLGALAVVRSDMMPFGLPAAIFAYVFAAGICADLLETRYRRTALIGIGAFLVLHAAAGIHSVVRVVSQS